MEAMNKNQEQLLSFLTQLLTQEEHCNFTLRNVSLCSGMYTFFPECVTIGYMAIIGNDEYWEEAEYYTKSNNTTTAYISCTDGNAKALFLKYKIRGFENLKSKFKKSSIREALEDRDIDYINSKNFPYITPAVEKLFDNCPDGEITDEAIALTLEQISMMDNEKTACIPNKSNYQKVIIKALNRA